MRRTKRVGLTVIACGALLLAACSDDSGSEESGTTTTGAPEATTTTVALTGEPVPIMVMFEGSGDVATPEVPEGAIAAADAVNRAGGLNGAPVEIIECDLANDPNTARECGQQAVDEGVVAVVGPVSPNAGEYFPLLEEAGIPIVGNVPASASDFTSAMSFPLYGGIVTASAGLADALIAEGGATTVSVARIDLAAASVISQFANTALARSDTEVENDVAIPVGAPDMATYVASVLENGTDGVLVGLTGQDATNFIIQLRQTNPDVPIAATTTEFDSVVEALGETSDGILTVGYFEDEVTDPDAYQQFVDDLAASGFGEDGGFRNNSYTAVQAVVELLADAPQPTSAALVEALNAATDLDLPLLPPIQFVEGGVAGIPRVFNPCGVYRQLEGGESTTLSDGFVDQLTGEPC